MVLVALFEAVVAFGILSCLSRVVYADFSRSHTRLKATNWRVFQGEQNGGILEYQRMQVMDISLLISDGTWVVYLSHTYLGVSRRLDAEAQVIPGV